MEETECKQAAIRLLASAGPEFMAGFGFTISKQEPQSGQARE